MKRSTKALKADDVISGRKTLAAFRFRLVVVGVLAVCLAPAAADAGDGDRRGTFGTTPPAVLCGVLSDAAAHDLETGDKRSRHLRLHPPAGALQPQRDLLPPGVSILLPFGYRERISPSTNTSRFAVRAPPPRST